MNLFSNTMSKVSSKKTSEIERKIGSVICGDCLEVIRKLPKNSVDSIVTDPP